MARALLSRVFVASIATVSLVGLAGCGAKLTLANARELELGKSTGEELTQRYGKPDSVQTKNFNNEVRETRTHTYTGTSAVVFMRIIDHRVLQAELKNGKLNGYYFLGTLGDNETKFDTAKAATIKNGMTRDQVQSVLGPPSGRMLRDCQITPLKEAIAPAAAEAWVYAMVDGATAAVWSDITGRSLIVSFDAGGKVVGTATESIDLK